MSMTIDMIFMLLEYYASICGLAVWHGLVQDGFVITFAVRQVIKRGWDKALAGQTFGRSPGQISVQNERGTCGLKKAQTRSIL
jgi:hypothetical protein